jgi:hypothetical protein
MCMLSTRATMVKRLTVDRIDYITVKTSCRNSTMNKYNLINGRGSISPAINKGKEVRLLRHNIQKFVTTVIQKENASL